jgi:glucosamine--fructose-6-phosphate aminotransferase (isomerizing)
MCGIVAYKGPDKCLPFLYEGLKRLEYRGYDSAGVAYIQNDHLIIYKQAGSVDDLKQEYLNFGVPAYIGMGHTRWATHGPPCSRNAHPHSTMDGRLAIVHNGIIENYQSLKTELLDKGYMFRSDTDTEVLLCLIYDYLITLSCDVFEAVKLSLERVVGAYAIVVMDIKKPFELVIARKGSPLVVGIGKKSGEFFVGSDCIAVAGYAEDIVYLEDGIVGKIDQNLSLYHLESNLYTPINIEKVEHQLEDIEKGDYESFMLKEIHEQPDSVARCITGRIDGYKIKFGGLLGYEGRISKAKHITIISCGSSWHAGLIAKYYIEELCGIKVSVEYASEFKYRKPSIEPGDIVIGISQSGETADTIGAIEIAKDKGAFCIGLCNSVNSSLTRLTNCGIYLKAGTEIGVASTKAFTNQIVTLLMLALWIEQNKNMNMDYRQSIIPQLYILPDIIQKTLQLSDSVMEIAQKFYKTKNCLYLGRGYNFPVALEGALKLKEISYIHAEGYPAAEMKHGPLALVDNKMPVIVIANNKNYQEKIINNIAEIQARSGRVVALVKESNLDIPSDYSIILPDTIDSLSPMVSSVILQLLAYYIATLRGCDIDKPRNLAKSVTVE